MSHELRTPVTVLRSSLEALCDGVIQEPEEVAEYHDSMLSETIHLQRMIGDLLELSRLQNPDYVMKFATLDLTQTIDDALRSANQIAAKRTSPLSVKSAAVTAWYTVTMAESGCRITVVFRKHRPGNNIM